ncbi:hypothetical protein EVJ58_g10611 [Rhodofomes roseus]|uniref:DUF6570 domain-containing protein n=1 Tax=Rhodofomes roseus TaxID=34475 RepID=A0A4Y9XQ80_9APHY|nr:hypothetical protein EVJ58_g10611 [Rhodofomes roseus]
MPGVHMRGSEEVLDVCSSCYGVVKAGRLPRRSLANGLWIGAVPPQLSTLTFVEKMLIARYRHNACVVEPVSRVYDFLPPPRTDLDEVLAVLFVGPCTPVGADFQRTPLLVRHQVVVDALNWLIKHHRDYTDVQVSYENLLAYPEDEPPVCVMHKTSDGLRPPESMAVHDEDGEIGTSSGQCEFVVHGLSADQLVDGKPMLAYGHGAAPSSMYHNPELFPGLFPWLFPYGLGGFENEYIQTKTDEYFPFIVFNQEQIRGSH